MIVNSNCVFFFFVTALRINHHIRFGFRMNPKKNFYYSKCFQWKIHSFSNNTSVAVTVVDFNQFNDSDSVEQNHQINFVINQKQKRENEDFI